MERGILRKGHCQSNTLCITFVYSKKHIHILVFLKSHSFLKLMYTINVFLIHPPKSTQLMIKLINYGNLERRF